MVFQPVPDTVRIDLLYRQTDALVNYQNSFYFRDATPGFPSSSDLTTLVDDVDAWWVANIQALCNTGVTLERLVGTDLQVENGLQATKVVNRVGTRAGADRAPVQTAALIQWRCDPGTLPKQGRTFHYGALDSDQGVNGLAGAYQTSLQAAYDALRSAPSAVSTALVIVSRYETLPGPPPVQVRRNPALTNTIAQVSVRTIQGAQRDRRT